MYTDLRDHDGHLLARLDPERWLLQIQRRGIQTLFDLREILAQKRAGDWHGLSVTDTGLAQLTRTAEDMQAAIIAGKLPGILAPERPLFGQDVTLTEAQKVMIRIMALAAPKSAEENDNERQ